MQDFLENKPIFDYDVLERGYYFRDGFCFNSTYVPNVGNIYDVLIIRNPENAYYNYRILGPNSERTLEEHIQLIRKYNIEKAIIVAESIDFIRECPSLREISIIEADTAPDNFDYSPLYDMPCIRKVGCLGPVDLLKINGLEEVCIFNKKKLNYTKVPTLKYLELNGCTWHTDLTDVCKELDLRELDIMCSNIKSLNGLEFLKNIEGLYLTRLRSLTDVSSIEKVAPTLKKLNIDTCSKIKDFSFLHSLTNLEWLNLYGSQTLPDLSFLDNMPNLKMFDFSMNIADGDLDRCMRIEKAVCHRVHRHYNLKNKELRKKITL